MTGSRLKGRQRRIWAQDYLVYKYLWPNIEQAVSQARGAIKSPVPVVLDVGCGEKPYMDLFDGCEYWGLNYGIENASPDVVGDSLLLPFRTDSVDIVFSTQVIEHVPDPFKMMQECARVLKPGGMLILTGPFYWPLHEEPHDYFRFTKYGFGRLLGSAGLTPIEIKADGGDWTQILLSINLRIPGRLWAPIRAMLNIMEALFERGKCVSCPLNYTVLAVNVVKPRESVNSKKTLSIRYS